MPGACASATLALEMADAAASERICRLDEFEGRHVVCPEDSCLFWEPGGGRFEGRCVLAGIDYRGEPGLAEWLAAMRRNLTSQE